MTTDIEHLLTATRSARRTLDLDAPIDWHMNHETLARGAREAWWRHRAGI